jgi:hypothetical protein
VWQCLRGVHVYGSICSVSISQAHIGLWVVSLMRLYHWTHTHLPHLTIAAGTVLPARNGPWLSCVPSFIQDGAWRVVGACGKCDTVSEVQILQTLKFANARNRQS